ncbi:MAG: sulfatase-like hydrolase/transferase [Akkermansiaceae bacterium]
MTLKIFLLTLLSIAQVCAEKPNIIFMMTDDQGWGDVAYNGNKIIKTPALDQMAKEGVRLDRFYAAAPVCSPTRGSVVTGRHPYRYGIEWAGEKGLPKEEVTLAETLKTDGYSTAHFGKWHIGQMSKTVKQTYFPGDKADPAHYSPPWKNGYDVTFATAASLPTYNPYYHDSPQLGTEGYKFLMDQSVKYGDTSGLRFRENYWTGPGKFIDENLAGCDSKIIMDQALQFIDESIPAKKPFFTTIWFHAGHTPIVAGDEWRKLYPNQPMQAQHWFGHLSAMDAQIGRLRTRLRELKISDNTIVFFCSDNGPSYIHNFNSAGPFSGKKATLLEGGIRVPGIVEWPKGFKGARSTNVPMSTSDIYPTLLAAAGITPPANQPILDGINVLPIWKGIRKKRSSYIHFQAPVMNDKNVFAKKGSLSICIQGDRFKAASFDGGKTWKLYDLSKDEAEKNDVSLAHPGELQKMIAESVTWRESCRKSAAGDDYQ